MAGNDAESVTFALAPPGQPSQSKEPSVAVVFSKCIAIYRQALSAIGKRVAVLSGTHQDQSMRALDEYGRLRMWGEQTKAVLQSETRGSLDNVLRKDEQLRGAVLNILTSLQAQLEICESLLAFLCVWLRDSLPSVRFIGDSSASFPKPAKPLIVSSMFSH